MTFITVNNVILDKEKVVCIIQDDKGAHRVTVWFNDGRELTFEGSEAAELWRHFDDGGWKE